MLAGLKNNQYNFFNINQNSNGSFKVSALSFKGMKEKLPVILVGAGRYTMKLAGPKYTKGNFPTEVIGVVDPYINRSTYENSVMRNIPLFENFEQLGRQIQDKSKCVVDLALKGSVIPQVISEYAQAGMKNFILPKPVAFTHEGLDTINSTIRHHGLNACIVSNWHFSDIPRKISQLLNKAKDKNLALSRAEMYFSKQRDRIDNVTPPLSELPHALQILESSGLINSKLDIPHLFEASPSKVAVRYKPAGTETDIRAFVDLQAKPGELEWIDRRLDLWFDNNKLPVKLPEKRPSDIRVNFNIRFDDNCQNVIRKGSIKLQDWLKVLLKEDNLEFGKNEDNLQKAYKRILNKFRKQTQGSDNVNTSQQSSEVLEFSEYLPLAKQLINIQKLWEKKAQPLPSQIFS
ncbi:MAG: hypothetical protein A2Y25_11670 [Candidatus Melainabacteria bacterium GWF2_37_15]|nr:MAG: hypothetical protein A2Y25_11670 [Candidatus Melainabacteria bacterium GWF2_37_15]